MPKYYLHNRDFNRFKIDKGVNIKRINVVSQQKKNWENEDLKKLNYDSYVSWFEKAMIWTMHCSNHDAHWLHIAMCRHQKEKLRAAEVLF